MCFKTFWVSDNIDCINKSGLTELEWVFSVGRNTCPHFESYPLSLPSCHWPHTHRLHIKPPESECEQILFTTLPELEPTYTSIHVRVHTHIYPCWEGPGPSTCMFGGICVCRCVCLANHRKTGLSFYTPANLGNILFIIFSNWSNILIENCKGNSIWVPQVMAESRRGK